MHACIAMHLYIVAVGGEELSEPIKSLTGVINLHDHDEQLGSPKLLTLGHILDNSAETTVTDHDSTEFQTDTEEPNSDVSSSGNVNTTVVVTFLLLYCSYYNYV